MNPKPRSYEAVQQEVEWASRDFRNESGLSPGFQVRKPKCRDDKRLVKASGCNKTRLLNILKSHAVSSHLIPLLPEFHLSAFHLFLLHTQRLVGCCFRNKIPSDFVFVFLFFPPRQEENVRVFFMFSTSRKSKHHCVFILCVCIYMCTRMHSVQVPSRWS